MHVFTSPIRNAIVSLVAAGTLASACNEDSAATNDTSPGDTSAGDASAGDTSAGDTGPGETTDPNCVPQGGRVTDPTCDGVDDDCDGATDDDYVGEPTTCEQATCVATGVFACNEGLVAADCSGQVCVPKLTLVVHDLGIWGVTDACFDVRITNAGGQVLAAHGDPTHAVRTGSADPSADATVASAKARGSLCRSDAGAAAADALTLIAPLPAGTYDVTLWVHSVFDLAGALDGTAWRNPCAPAGDGVTPATWAGGCTLGVVHHEGGSSHALDLEVIREANQGFFDIAVQFSGAFCSARVDTCMGGTPNAAGTAGGDPIALLFPVGGSERVRSAVVSFSCTSGDPTHPAELFASDLTLSCEEDGSAASGWQPQARAERLTLTGAEGNQLVQAPTPLLHQWAIYRGSENLPCGPAGESTCAKRYWNAALAIREDAPSDVAGASPGAANCRVTGVFTATVDGANMNATASGNGFAAGPRWNLPAVEFSVRLTDANAHWDCRSVPLGSDDPAGVDYDLDAVYPENSGGAFNSPAFCGRFADVVTRATGAGCAQAP